MKLDIIPIYKSTITNKSSLKTIKYLVGEDPSRLKTILRFFNWFLDVFPGSKYKMKGSFVKANKGFSIKLITITIMEK
jgi:hypothetical protein